MKWTPKLDELIEITKNDGTRVLVYGNEIVQPNVVDAIMAYRCWLGIAGPEERKKGMPPMNALPPGRPYRLPLPIPPPVEELRKAQAVEVNMRTEVLAVALAMGLAAELMRENCGGPGDIAVIHV